MGESVACFAESQRAFASFGRAAAAEAHCAGVLLASRCTGSQGGSRNTVADRVSDTSRTATIVFTGVFDPARFVEFVQHRARRLDLVATLIAISQACISVVVTGQPDLIEAFEMACSLGPRSCLVLDVSRVDAAP
jgi:acylphosphatase